MVSEARRGITRPCSVLQRIRPDHSTLLTPRSSPRPAGVNCNSLNNSCEVSEHLFNAQPLYLTSLSLLNARPSYSLFSEKGLDLPLPIFPNTFSSPPVGCQRRHPSSQQHPAAAGWAVVAPQLRGEPACAHREGTAPASSPRTSHTIHLPYLCEAGTNLPRTTGVYQQALCTQIFPKKYIAREGGGGGD